MDAERTWMSRKWLLSFVAATVVASTVEGFQSIPSAKVFQTSACSSTNLRMFPVDVQPAGDGNDKERRTADGNDKERRVAEFMNLEPVAESETRRARLERDRETKDQFAEYGDELWNLRKKTRKMGDKLVGALDGSSKENEQLIREELREAESRDPELVYEMELLEMELARREGDTNQAEKSKQRALSARGCLPHYNLEGLWVGKYGSHGYEMINVTYVGDTLVAYKVTGDANVPRGEITFQADLSPNAVKTLRDSHPAGGSRSEGGDLQQKPLEPIQLTEKAASKWGTRQLPRYRGLGQVAEAGFKNNRWMDGQLIIIGEEYFSFAWVPLENQIFFGRPSPELALKMLREGGIEAFRGKSHWEAPPSMDDDVDVLKDYVSSCLEKTTQTLEDHMPAGGDPFGCIWHDGTDAEECYFE